MPNAQFDLFYQNWLSKSDNYNENILSGQFDKFISLYVAYNAIYMEVINELTIAGYQLPKDYKDKKAATDYVAQYLGGKYYIENLLNDEVSLESYNVICDIIEQNKFHIILELGVPQRHLDEELLKFLKSNSSQEKSKAILSTLYHIRCNIFHGQKDFNGRQSELLRPAIYLLRKTLIMTYNKLNQ